MEMNRVKTIELLRDMKFKVSKRCYQKKLLDIYDVDHSNSKLQTFYPGYFLMKFERIYIQHSIT